MMPFFQDDMNSWSVYIQKQMTDWRYGEDCRIAWVPERVWVSPEDNDGNGIDASAGVIDWIGDDWHDNGIWAVVLDQDVHCGYMNNPANDRHIYEIENGLKIIPIDNTFVGNVNYDGGAAWNTILAGGADELIVYGNDWEVAAEVSQGAGNPNALGNYIYVIQQCSWNSSVVSTWKLTDALYNFGTTSITLQNGTYWMLGNFYGYGGGNNQWYTDWASYNDPLHSSDQHDPIWDYGYIWYDAYMNLTTAPDNSCSQAGWYVLMTNIHETGWHDGFDISGWIHRYSNHIKNSNVYTEASRWANGSYPSTGAYLYDMDHDGQDEGVLFNDRVLAVFEPIGGRAVWVFAKGSGYAYPVVGNCNVYWADTEGDYNEGNHIAAFSDVSVAGIDREHDLYSISVTSGSGDSVALKLTHEAVEKVISLELGNPYLDAIYNTYGREAYIKSGFSPDLVDLIWNADLYRVWKPGSGLYHGQRNPNTGATAAHVIGSGGASHNAQFSATLLEVDEIRADGKFEFYLYAGYTSPPDSAGNVSELQALLSGLTDRLAPEPLEARYYPGPNRLDVYFDEVVRYDAVVLTGISIDDDDDGIAEVTFTGSETILSSANSTLIRIGLTQSTADAIEALQTSQMELMLAAGAFQDPAGNGNRAVTNTDDVQVLFGPETMITIDGFIDTSEWLPYTIAVEDPEDSEWTTPTPGDTNEIDRLYAFWDSTYLYLGIDGKVYNNSWLLYIDADPGGPDGETDLTAIDIWERGATFTASGFKADFEYGCYQHQSVWDGDGLWAIDSPTTTTDLSDSIFSQFDSHHTYGNSGGSELAIPWNVLYGLGPGNVTPNAQLSIVASVCWDPEPDGELGGDSAPNNNSASLPQIDNVHTFTVDSNGDGKPDYGTVGVENVGGSNSLSPVLVSNYPNPFNPKTTFQFFVPGSPNQRSRVGLGVYDVRGSLVRNLADGEFEAGFHTIEWDGTDERGDLVSNGVYFYRLAVDDEVLSGRAVMLK
jgi:hypothetical protein